MGNRVVSNSIYRSVGWQRDQTNKEYREPIPDPSRSETVVLDSPIIYQSSQDHYYRKHMSLKLLMSSVGIAMQLFRAWKKRASPGLVKDLKLEEHYDFVKDSETLMKILRSSKVHKISSRDLTRYKVDIHKHSIPLPFYLTDFDKDSFAFREFADTKFIFFRKKNDMRKQRFYLSYRDSEFESEHHRRFLWSLLKGEYEEVRKYRMKDSEFSPHDD